MNKTDWGTTACLYQFGRNKTSSLTDVPVTVGRKYVTVQNRWKQKFLIENGREVDQCMSYNLLFPTREAAEAHIRMNNIRCRLSKYLSYNGKTVANKMTIEQEEQLLAMFEEATP